MNETAGVDDVDELGTGAVEGWIDNELTLVGCIDELELNTGEEDGTGASVGVVEGWSEAAKVGAGISDGV